MTNMTTTKRQEMQEELIELKTRLANYLEKERDILAGGVQSYGIGNRNLARYNADLSNVRLAIKEIKKEIQDLNAMISGRGSRRAMRIIPQDW